MKSTRRVQHAGSMNMSNLGRIGYELSSVVSTGVMRVVQACALKLNRNPVTVRTCGTSIRPVVVQKSENRSISPNFA